MGHRRAAQVFPFRSVTHSKCRWVCKQNQGHLWATWWFHLCHWLYDDSTRRTSSFHQFSISSAKFCPYISENLHLTETIRKDYLAPSKNVDRVWYGWTQQVWFDPYLEFAGAVATYYWIFIILTFLKK